MAKLDPEVGAEALLLELETAEEQATLEEAKAIVKKNEEEGLVMQPFNSQKVGGMCSC